MTNLKRDIVLKVSNRTLVADDCFPGEDQECRKAGNQEDVVLLKRQIVSCLPGFLLSSIESWTPKSVLRAAPELPSRVKRRPRLKPALGFRDPIDQNL